MSSDDYRRSALRVRYNVLEHELTAAECREDERFLAIERELAALEAKAEAGDG